jgi:hypothetical protein
MQYPHGYWKSGRFTVLANDVNKYTQQHKGTLKELCLRHKVFWARYTVYRTGTTGIYHAAIVLYHL